MLIMYTHILTKGKDLMSPHSQLVLKGQPNTVPKLIPVQKEQKVLHSNKTH